jgi:spore germination protein GerM
MAQNSSKESSLHLLDENFVTFHICLVLPRGEHLNPTFMKQIDRLTTSGLVQKFEKEKNLVNTRATHGDDEDPRPLTMDHLGVCFIAVMIFLCLSLVIFTVECLSRSFAI